MSNFYYINKKNISNDIIFIDYNRLKGFNFKPQNNVKYDGIVVNKIIIVKPSLIEKVLKRKIKHKLDLYLRLIIKIIDDSDDTDGQTLREALNDLTRYRQIVEYKYRKYLDEKYIDLLLKKIEILKYEIKSKMIINYNYQEIVEEKSRKSR